MQVPSDTLQDLSKAIQTEATKEVISGLMVHEAGTEAETECIIMPLRNKDTATSPQPYALTRESRSTAGPSISRLWIAARRKMLKISSVLHQAPLRVPLIVKCRCCSTRMPPTPLKLYPPKDLLDSCHLLLATCLVGLGVKHLTSVFPTTSSEHMSRVAPSVYAHRTASGLVRE